MNTTNKTVKMSKGFTMIELIFVIVIIGILAAVAIPRLAATRDDAKVAQCSADVATLMKDLSSYYTSQGNFAADTKTMTNVELLDTDDLSSLGTDAKTITYACDKPTAGDVKGTAAVTFAFTKDADANNNQVVTMNASIPAIVDGTVDGDLGTMLTNKNIAAVAPGRDHTISGIRVKR